LAGSRPAQAAFRAIQQHWVQASPSERIALEPALRAFLAQYAEDDRARLVRVYLAWIDIEKGQLAAARALVATTQDGPAGSARDFAVVTDAAIYTRQGEPARALTLLLPLRGKIIDPEERVMFGEQLVRAALGAKRYLSAIDYMLDWLAAAPEEDRELVQAQVQNLLGDAPPAALESSLLDLEKKRPNVVTDSNHASARDWLRRWLSDRLTRLALKRHDARLAERLLHEGPPTLRVGPRGDQLAELAASGSVLPRVAGRTLGLVLSLGSADERRRSAEVAVGMSRALGLPGSAAAPGAVRLITRDDSGKSDGTERALAELAGDGATILVAGVDADGAERAARYAERESIPTIVLGGAPKGAAMHRFAFFLGADPKAALGVLSDAVKQRGATSPALVGPGGVPCDVTAAQAGQPRFPIEKWKRDRLDALELTGDRDCARDAIAELGQVRLHPLLAFGLESADLFGTLGGAQTQLAVSAGSFPVRSGDSEPASLQRWTRTAGSPPSWYAALGHDAGALGAAALANFPLRRADDKKVVAELHAEARRRLADARAELWTTAETGFAGAQSLPRRLQVLAAAGGKRHE
jgi:Periplasmic binding protein